MEKRLKRIKELANRMMHKAVEQENWDAYDRYENLYDVLHYIETNDKPISTSGYFHFIDQ